MPQQGWSEAENWVWERIRGGEIADFHARLGKRNPNAAEGWDDARRLSTAFLRRIFSDRSLRDDIPSEGVRIIGAWFPDGLAFPHGRLHEQLWLDDCRFGREVDLSFCTIQGVLSFEGSAIPEAAPSAPALALTGSRISDLLNLSRATITGKLDIAGLQVGADLLMTGSVEEPARFAEVDLTSAEVKGRLSLEGATVTGKLGMNGLRVGQSLFLEGSAEQPARFAAVDLTGAAVGGQLSLNGATVTGKLGMNGLRVGQSLFLEGSAEQPAGFAEVDLTSAEVKGRLSLEGATVAGTLGMNGLRVGQSLFLEGSAEQPARFAAVDLTGAAVGGQLSLNGATVTGRLGMNGLRVGQSLFLEGSAEQPAGFAEVDLTSAEVKGRLSLEGATVAGTLGMNGLRVGQSLFLEGSAEQPARFAAVDLTGAAVGGQLSLNGATVTGRLGMNGLRVGQSLFLEGSAEQPARFAAVDLTNAEVRGQLSLEGATVMGKLGMNSLQVGQSLFMRGSAEQPARFAEVDLTGADVKGQLSLDGAAVTGKLGMAGLQVGEDLLMIGSVEQPATFAEVDLTEGKVGRAVRLAGASFERTVTLDRVTIGTDLDVSSLRPFGCERDGRGLTASMQFVNVGGSLDLHGAALHKLDLSGSKITGELRLRAITWSAEDARLVLRNARAAVLDDDAAQWPPRMELELDGFTYDRVKGTGESEEMALGRREWCELRIEGWLERDLTYTPQPYEQFAEVLRKAGEPSKAAAVLYAGRERARRHERERYVAQWRRRAGQRVTRRGRPHLPVWYGSRHAGLTLLKWTTGYGLGLRYFRCLWWIAGLTLLGTVVVSVDAMHINFARSLVYSFQKLLPSFAKIEEFPRVRLGTFARWYFYAHQLAGYVLAGFLAAGLAGLTQKSS